MTNWDVLSSITVDDVLEHWAAQPSDGCWEVQVRRTKRGYGASSIHGQYVTSHRLMYFVTTRSAPINLVVRHSCDNPPCVRPSHLLLGTQVDNVRDMVERGRARGGGNDSEAYVASRPRGDNHWTRKSNPHLHFRLRTCECGLSTYAGPMGSHVKKYQHKLVS